MCAAGATTSKGGLPANSIAVGIGKPLGVVREHRRERGLRSAWAMLPTIAGACPPPVRPLRPPLYSRRSLLRLRINRRRRPDARHLRPADRRRCPASCSPKTTTTCAASWRRRCRTPATTSSPSTTAARAYERIREEPFTLLLTDIVMPEMDGIELARRATELDPDLKVMFITGFAAVALNPDSNAPEGRQGPVEAVPPQGPRRPRSRSCSRPERAAARRLEQGS